MQHKFLHYLGHLVAGVALLGCIPAYALDIPIKSDKDHRVRYANYDETNVIQIDAVVGVATHIELEPGESYVFHVFGDSSAYEFTHKLNHLFFKPKVDQADSNLTVITNRRSYNFKLNFQGDGKANALYKLVVQYPDAQHQAQSLANEQTAMTQAMNTAAASAFSWQSYTKAGDLVIAPVHAWDNGVQTWMQFAPGAEIPAIYRVDGSSQELLTNATVVDNRTIMLHRVSARWHVRLGQQVVAIRNHASGASNAFQTGTASPDVMRVVRGQQPTWQPSAPVAAKVEQALPIAVNAPAQTAPVMTSSTDKQPPVHMEMTQGLVLDTQFILPSSSAGTSQKQAAPVPASNAHVAQVKAQPYVPTDGDRSLLPQSIQLEGENTVFGFDGKGIPALVALDGHGDEYLASLHIEPGNRVVMHEQPPGWRLRANGQSLTLMKGDQNE